MKLRHLCAVAGMVVTGSLFAEEKKEGNDWGKLSGTVGTYFEATDTEKTDGDFEWLTGYLKLNYETKRFAGFKLGIEGFGHAQLYNASEEGADKYESDIEDRLAVTQVYVDYAFTEKTHLRLGRFNHKKISHLDDSHSQGFYLESKELKNWSFVLGAMEEFAEYDYDDGEDFGRRNGAQDLSDDGTYGEDSSNYVLFAEATYKNDNIKLNPYVYWQNDYASVYGLDTILQTKVGEDVTVGVDVRAYHVASEVDGTADAEVYGVAPFVKFGDFTLVIGRTNYDDSDTMNKPAWLTDYMTDATGVWDQKKIQTGGALSRCDDCTADYIRLKYKKGGFKASIGVMEYNYDQNATYGDGSTEIEFITGYKFDCGLDMEVRFFDVTYDNVDDKDFQKMEARVRYSF